MARLVHRRVFAARIGDDAVFVEALAHVFVARGEGHVHAPAQVANDRARVALETRDHFHLARVVERAAGWAGA